jgi:acyl-CoA thioesterase-2
MIHRPALTPPERRSMQVEDFDDQPTHNVDTPFLDRLSLKRIDRDIFTGWCHAGSPLKAFGGQVAAQALVAAGTTVEQPGRRVHSLHSYFLRPGSTTDHIVYLVDRPRDGRSFSTRRVRAVQYGVTIFTMSASFASPQQGPEHESTFSEETTEWVAAVPPPADVPQVDLLAHLDISQPGADPKAKQELRAAGYPTERVNDVRVVDRDQVAELSCGRWDQMTWVRTREALPDDSLVHVCALTYFSDMTLVGTVLAHHGGRTVADGRDLASLDHAMWFHRHFRADDWLLFVTDSPVSGAGRGFARGEFFTESGHIVASAAQEILIRDRVWS